MKKQEKPLEAVNHFESIEEEQADFQESIEGLVKAGLVSRTGEFGTGLDKLKDYLRPIAEVELDRQGK